MYTERCGTCIHARICRRPKHAVRTWLAIFRMNILCYGSVGFIVTRWHRAGLEVQLCQEEMPTFVNSFFAILCYHVLSTLWLHDTAGPTHASTAWISLRTPPSTCSTRSCSWLWKSRAPSALSDWCAVGGGARRGIALWPLALSVHQQSLQQSKQLGVQRRLPGKVLAAWES